MNISPLKRVELSRELSAVLNRHSIDNEMATPDFILAEFLVQTLENVSQLTESSKAWSEESPASPESESGPTFFPEGNSFQIIEIPMCEPCKNRIHAGCTHKSIPCGCTCVKLFDGRPSKGKW